MFLTRPIRRWFVRSDGRVAFLGGDPAESVILDPSTNAFVAGPELRAKVARQSVWLPPDHVLFMSGNRSNLDLYSLEAAR